MPRRFQEKRLIFNKRLPENNAKKGPLKLGGPLAKNIYGKYYLGNTTESIT
jgi:hypothetical protein